MDHGHFIKKRFSHHDLRDVFVRYQHNKNIYTPKPYRWS